MKIITRIQQIIVRRSNQTNWDIAFVVIVSRKEPEVTLEAMTDRFVMYSFGQEMAAGKWNTWIFVIHRCCYVSAFDILIYTIFFYDWLFSLFFMKPYFFYFDEHCKLHTFKIKVITRSQFKLYPATQWLNISSTEKWKHLPYIIIILSWKIVSVNWKKIDPWNF